MKKQSAMNFTAWDAAWPIAAGLGLGVGSRLARWGYDINKDTTRKGRKSLDPVVPAEVPVPVRVTKEEAEELERQGISVPRRSKTAASTLLDTTAQGVIGSLAAIYGWRGIDKVLDNRRRSQAESRLGRSRDRVARLIDDRPDEEDYGLHSAMKVAADIYESFCDIHRKTAGVGSGVLYGALKALSPLGIPLGVGGTIAASRAFNEKSSRNKYNRRIKAMRDYFNQQRETRPVASLIPYLDEDEDQRKTAAERRRGPSWFWWVLAGGAGLAGLMWVARNPEAAKSALPQWAHGTIDSMADMGRGVAGASGEDIQRAGAELAQRGQQLGDPEAVKASLAVDASELLGETIDPEDIVLDEDAFARVHGMSDDELVAAASETYGPENVQAWSRRHGAENLPSMMRNELLDNAVVTSGDVAVQQLLRQNPERMQVLEANHPDYAEHILSQQPQQAPDLGVGAAASQTPQLGPYQGAQPQDDFQLPEGFGLPDVAQSITNPQPTPQPTPLMTPGAGAPQTAAHEIAGAAQPQAQQPQAPTPAPTHLGPVASSTPDPSLPGIPNIDFNFEGSRPSGLPNTDFNFEGSRPSGLPE